MRIRAREDAGGAPGETNLDHESHPRLVAQLIILSLGWVMIYADRLSISPLLNLIQREFSLSFSAAGLVMSIYFLAYVVVAVPATLLAERIGYKKTMVVLFLLAAVSLGLAGVVGYSYYPLLILVGIHGIGAGAYFPTAYKISSLIVPTKSRGYSSAIINSGMGFGSILGLVIAGPILVLFSRWQTVLLVLAIPTGIVALLLNRGVTAPERHNGSNVRHHFKRLLRNRELLKVYAITFCSLYGYWVILTWAPSFLQTTRHLDIFYSGLVTALFSAIAIPSSIVLARFSDRIGRRMTAMILLPLASLAIFVMAFASNIVVFLMAIAAYGIVGKLSLDPVMVAWITDTNTTETTGAALALLNVFGMASSILAPVLTGLLADVSGTLIYGFYFGAAMVLLGSVFALFSRASP